MKLLYFVCPLIVVLFYLFDWTVYREGNSLMRQDIARCSHEVSEIRQMEGSVAELKSVRKTIEAELAARFGQIPLLEDPAQASRQTNLLVANCLKGIPFKLKPQPVPPAAEREALKTTSIIRVEMVGAPQTTVAAARGLLRTKWPMYLSQAKVGATSAVFELHYPDRVE